MKKISFLLLLPFILSFISSCDMPTDFHAPNWDADIHLPITEREYRLSEVVKVNKNIQVDSTLGIGSLLYKVVSDDYIQTFQINDFLKDQLNGSYDGFTFFVSSVDTTVYIDLQSGASIDSAFILDGELEIIITSKSKGDLTFNLELPAFTDSQGKPATIGGVVPANSNRIFSSQIKNYGYSSKNQASSKKLWLKVKCNGQFTGEEATVTFNIKNTKFYLVSGSIPSKQLNPIEKSVGLPITNDVKGFRDKLTLHTATLMITADYVTKEQAQVFDVLLKDVKLLGKVNGGQSVSLKSNNGENWGDFLIQNGKFIKQFDNLNSNISEFLKAVPDSITLLAGVIVNPTGNTGTATIDDTVKVKVNFFTKSYLNLDEYETSDTLDIEIEKDLRDEMTNGKYARIIYEITNEIPVEGSCEITFTDLAFNPLFTAQPVKVKGGKIINENTVEASNPKPAEEVKLVYDEIQKFAKAYKAIVKVKAKTTEAAQGQRTYVGPEMKMKIKTYGEIKYHIDPEK